MTLGTGASWVRVTSGRLSQVAKRRGPESRMGASSQTEEQGKCSQLIDRRVKKIQSCYPKSRVSQYEAEVPTQILPWDQLWRKEFF